MTSFQGVLDEELEFNLSSMITELGDPTVVIRNVTLLAGSNPQPNPPVYSGVGAAGLFVSGTNPLGAGVLNIRALSVAGRIVTGDKFKLPGDVTLYSATGIVNAVSNAFAAVPIAPNLLIAHLDGETITPTWLADHTITALVTNYPARLINNTSIQATDKQVRFLASAVAFRPVDTMKVFVQGDQFSIVTVKPMEVQGRVYGWSVQIRR